ncbi:hypothetical protein EL22_28400 [Halostagnicola sp. A56]|uniref:hypothetical protein n=1 Tax=Halostagnicola sp. A56 TaxID=1495067 RepID=UPI00065F6AB4|nr:hypothetical protein [Halostagnicola sp. A56]KMT45670.1 hypothetical protein EL22_28400 [Halostagnicola sp. A56]
MATTDEDGNGFTVDDDSNLEVTGETTILGVNGFMVHDESSNVEDPSSAEPGETLAFEADNIDTDGSVEHGIALYHEDTFLDQETIIKVTEEPDSNNFSEDAIQLESTLTGVDGVTAIDNDSSLMGFTQDLENHTGQVDFESVLGLVRHHR